MPKNSKAVKRELDDDVTESVKDLLSNEDACDDSFKKSSLIVNNHEGEGKECDVEEGGSDGEEEERPAWNSKLQYILAQVGFSVGLGNVWRFPYLVPYLILLILIGIPLFFLELAVGQRIRRGSIGVWNYISPRLGGIGFASCRCASLWLSTTMSSSAGVSSTSPSPSSNLVLSVDVEPECEKSSATTYYWYREALDISNSISEGGGLNWKMTVCLLVAWFMVCLAMIKGIQSSRVDLLLDSGSAPEGLRRWDSTHVHTQGKARFKPAFPQTLKVPLRATVLMLLCCCRRSLRFFEDLKDMLGFTPYRFYYYMWKYITPILLLVLLCSSLIQLTMTPPSYSAWIQEEAKEQTLHFPPWGIVVCISLVVMAIMPVPVVFGLRYFNIIDENTTGLSTVSYKKGRIIKESARPGEDDDTSLIQGKSPSEAPSPMPGNSIYRKQSGSAGGPDADTAPNGRYGIGYLMADMPDMPESDL